MIDKRVNFIIERMGQRNESTEMKSKINQNHKKTDDIKTLKQDFEITAFENTNVTLTCNLTHDYFELKWTKLNGVSK